MVYTPGRLFKMGEQDTADKPANALKKRKNLLIKSCKLIKILKSYPMLSNYPMRLYNNALVPNKHGSRGQKWTIGFGFEIAGGSRRGSVDSPRFIKQSCP